MHLLPTEPKLADDSAGNVRIPNKLGLVLSTEAARKRGGTPQRIVRGKNGGKDRPSRQIRKHACSHGRPCGLEHGLRVLHCIRHGLARRVCGGDGTEEGWEQCEEWEVKAWGRNKNKHAQ
jgi:hypothetical protein